MRLKRILILSLIAGLFIPLVSASVHPPTGRAAVNIYASPIQAGCYRAKPDRCSIHVDPFTINLAPGSRLVLFQLLASRSRSGSSRVIYDFRPDLSNPVPLSGSAYTPSRVAKDFAANCGDSYSITLLGQDTLDPNPYVLGQTSEITCPTGEYTLHLPFIRR
jgi:hypothetical protein